MVHVNRAIRWSFLLEINIYFRGFENLDTPSVFVFPKVLVGLECGSSRFTAPEAELRVLSAQLRSCSTRWLMCSRMLVEKC